MQSKAQIKIMARFPVPGVAKTRLIPVLGPRGAARLQRRMTENVLAAARRFCRIEPSGQTKITICCAGARVKQFKAWLGPDLDYEEQPAGDLGFRMAMALRESCGRQSEATVLVGSDLPGLDSEILGHAFEFLKNNDLVLGPAADGGYYLIGMKSFYPELFENISWGTGQVYRQTTEIIHKMGFAFKSLPLLQDVDRPEDLDLLRRKAEFSDLLSDKPLLSVIIPTLNEEKILAATLKRVRCGQCIETVVADGGSRDSTALIAKQAGARFIEASPGRFSQQNAGASMARGELFLFLHADTLLPPGYDRLIREALEDPETVAGAFGFKTDDSRWVMRVVELLTNVRSRLFKLPYADQGLFVPKRVFDEMDGFAPIPIMEDFELVLRLRRRGSLHILDQCVITSARRWQRLGVVRTTVINQLMILGFIIGLPKPGLKAFYQLNKGLGQEKNEANKL